MITKLPHWILTEPRPSFYETESKTAVEMVAKLYKTVQDIITDYNTFIDTINEELDNFTRDTNNDIDSFKVSLRQEFQDFIDIITLKINEQDADILDAISFMKTNITTTLGNLINSMEENGELDATIIHALESSLTIQVRYNETTETLMLTNNLIDVLSYDNGSEHLVITEADMTHKEDKSNKVVEITETSNDNEYPSAKAVFDMVSEEIEENILNELGGDF